MRQAVSAVLAAPSGQPSARAPERPLAGHDPGRRHDGGPSAAGRGSGVHRARIRQRGAGDLGLERRVRGEGRGWTVRRHHRESGGARHRQGSGAGCRGSRQARQCRDRARRGGGGVSAGAPAATAGSAHRAAARGRGRSHNLCPDHGRRGHHPVRAGDLLRRRRVSPARRLDRAPARRRPCAHVLQGRRGRELLLRRDDAGRRPVLRQAAPAQGRGEPDHVLPAVHHHGVRGEPDHRDRGAHRGEEGRLRRPQDRGFRSSGRGHGLLRLVGGGHRPPRLRRGRRRHRRGNGRPHRRGSGGRGCRRRDRRTSPAHDHPDARSRSLRSRSRRSRCPHRSPSRPSARPRARGRSAGPTARRSCS